MGILDQRARLEIMGLLVLAPQSMARPGPLLLILAGPAKMGKMGKMEVMGKTLAV
ncbi:MAG TPA: hypothetical protein VFQ92_11300 [Blastocatellia bacterium]|nr:hypothetical protein [Blastocatellia bacterium]